MLQFAAVLVICAAPLAGCDSDDPVENRAVQVGPPRSAFPSEDLFQPDQIESLVEHATAQSRGATSDTLVIVPLVFDEDGYLYSPLGFNLALKEALDNQPAEGAGPDASFGTTYFTDEATFERVVASGGSSQVLYSSKTGPAAEVSDQTETPVKGRDIYSCADNPADCPTPLLREPVSGPPPSNPGPTIPTPPSGRGMSNVATTYGLAPSWPQMWQGDIVSGHINNNQPFGHDGIVTQLNTGGNTGGAFTSFETKTMEAVGNRSRWQDEVVERAARSYWLDTPGRRTDDVFVRYHPTATWTQRATSISYARGQDNDTYNMWAPKVDRARWYCSKLVWGAYGRGTGDDLDYDWGWWVFPTDIEHSNVLRTVYQFRYNG